VTLDFLIRDLSKEKIQDKPMLVPVKKEKPAVSKKNKENQVSCSESKSTQLLADLDTIKTRLRKECDEQDSSSGINQDGFLLTDTLRLGDEFTNVAQEYLQYEEKTAAYNALMDEYKATDDAITKLTPVYEQMQQGNAKVVIHEALTELNEYLSDQDKDLSSLITNLMQNKEMLISKEKMDHLKAILIAKNDQRNKALNDNEQNLLEVDKKIQESECLLQKLEEGVAEAKRVQSLFHTEKRELEERKIELKKAYERSKHCSKMIAQQNFASRILTRHPAPVSNE
jgi:hypothetical protein